MDNYGKKFEKRFEQDWKTSFPPNKCDIERLYDLINGFKSVSQISDYVCYACGTLYYMECKTTKGGTFPLERLTQYDKLKTKVGIDGVKAGVVIWFYEKDKVVYVPITTVTQLLIDGKKSVNIKYLETKEYKLIEIPSKKLRTFLQSDYSILQEVISDGRD